VPALNATQQLPQEKLAEDLDQVEEAMTGLQVLYEKYFLGLDRRPPDAQRRQVSEKMRVLKTTTVKNTALKFRIQTLFAKLIAFERMWDRTLREIEEGTYKRDVYKAKLREARRGSGEQRPAQSAAASSQLSDQMIRKLYDTYLVARQRTGESTAGLTYEGIAGRIRAQVTDLMARHKARNVEFKVVIKGGKAILKAIPQT
jgi:murein L,D-transpeptidase YcbB/YkuD